MRINYNVKTGVTRIKSRARQLTNRFTIASFALVGSLGIALMPAVSAASAIVVTPTNTQGWATQDGAPTYVNGPSGADGAGSLEFMTDSTDASKQNYFHATNTPLADAAGMGYMVDVTSGVPASYQLQVTGVDRLDSTSTFTSLVWEPAYNGQVNGPNGGFVTESNLESGTWWSSHPIAGDPAGVDGFVSLDQIKAANPEATVVAFGINVGSGTPNATSYVDDVSFMSDMYNFEPTAPTVKVTIDKYIDGTMATTASANSSSFPMQSSWSADNIGSGSGNYSLSPTGYNSPNPYEAVTSDMSQGASYSTNEVTGGSVVAAACTVGGAPYALVGYSTGDTLAEAQAATPSTTAPSFTDLQNDKYVIVWNQTCPPAPAHPTNKDQCKDNGWMTLADSNNRSFKNQGDCVSYVATQGKNKANG
jgi:hypothetical protein